MSNQIARKLHSPSGLTGSFLVRVLCVLIALVIRSLLYIKVLKDSDGFIAYNLILLIYLGYEILSLYKTEKKLFWINPVVMASILTFILGYGISNIIFIIPEEFLTMTGLRPVVSHSMVQLMFLVILGSVSMWVGYMSGIGRRMAQGLKQNLLLKRIMLKTPVVDPRAIYVLLVVSFVSRSILIRMGVFGFSADFDEITSRLDYLQYLMIGASLGRLALVGAAVQCYSVSHEPKIQSQSKKHVLLLQVVIVHEVMFGFLSGFKSAVVMPFIIVGLMYYAIRSRFPKWLIPVVLGGIFLAYGVIEPFRRARYNSPDFDATSVVSIANTMLESTDQNSADLGNRTDVKVLARSNLTFMGAVGLEYAEKTELPKDSPSFLADIFTAPFRAYIPRILWPSKSMSTIGLWYNYVVLGNPGYSSAAMGPVTYLHFAGGPLAVILGFLVVGVFQRGLFEGLTSFRYSGLIVYVGLLGTLGTIDSSYDGFFIEIFRYTPILILLQMVMLQSNGRLRRNTNK